jgi:acyl carrier protein
MENNEITLQIKEIIEKYAFDKGLIKNATEQSKIVADLKINSARIVDIILDIEEVFNITIEDNLLEKMITIGDATLIVQMKLKNL